MLKYIRIAFRFGIYFVLRLPKMLYYSIRKDKISYEKRYDFIRKLAYKLNERLKITYEVEGAELLPKTNRLVFLPNHQSIFDLVALISILEHRVTFISKKETAKVPVVRTLINIAEALYLDRNNARSALKTLKDAAEDIERDRNLLIFLEGTRSRDENHGIGEFKSGGLRPAYLKQATLVPIILDNSWEVFDKKNNKKKYVIKFRYLKPITYEEYKDFPHKELALNLENIFKENLAKLRQ